MLKDLIGQVIFAGVKAAAPIIRKKIVEQYQKLKTKAEATPKVYDDIGVFIIGVAIGEEE